MFSTMGMHLMTTEGHGAWTLKMTAILLAPDPGVTAQELAAALPTFEELVVWANAGLSTGYMSTALAHWNNFTLTARACEKLGLFEQALAFAEHAATSTDLSNGGSVVPSTFCDGFRTKGRCLASTGQLQAAEQAFESALSSVEGLGLFLMEVLALRDLKVCVLDKDGRGTEGSARLKASIHQLLGAAPAADQLAGLAAAVGPEVDLAAVLA